MTLSEIKEKASKIDCIANAKKNARQWDITVLSEREQRIARYNHFKRQLKKG